MRKTPLLVIGFLSLLIIGGVIFLSGSSSANTVQASSSRQHSYAQKSYSRALGIPAIHPHLITAQTNTATFTESDVRQYITTHPLSGRVTFTPGSKPTIVKIQFLPSAEVSKLINDSTGMPDSYLLCYVELQGTANFTGPAGSNGTLHKIHEVFDAQTGNLLIIGGW